MTASENRDTWASLKGILGDADTFLTEHLALLKTRFKSVIEAVQTVIKPVIPEWREYVVIKEDKERIQAAPSGGKLTGAIGDAYTLGKAVHAEVTVLNLR